MPFSIPRTDKTKPPLHSETANSAGELMREVQGLFGLNLSKLSLAGEDLKGVRFHHCVFDGTNLANADLTGAAFNSCVLDCDLSGAVLNKATVVYTVFKNQCRLTFASFLGARLEHSNFGKVNGIGARFGDAVINQCSWAEAKMHGACFRGARFPNCYFSHADFHDCCFAGAVFSGSSVYNTDFRRSDFSGATCGLFRALSDTKTDITGADFTGAEKLQVWMLPADRRLYFECPKCHCVEVSGLCNYHNGVMLCSKCDPSIGKWHDSICRMTLNDFRWYSLDPVIQASELVVAVAEGA